MTKAWTRLACALGLAATAVPAAAHHSLAGYDQNRPLELTGEVTEFHYTQPHPYLVIAAPGPGGGAPQPWKLEMDNLWELDAIGVTSGTFKARDRVSVSGSPDRSGGHAMYLRRLDRASDGLRYEQIGMSPRLTVQKR